MSEKKEEPSGKIGLTKNHKIRKLKIEFSTEGLKPLAERLAQLIENELEQTERVTSRGIEEEILQRLQMMRTQFQTLFSDKRTRTKLARMVDYRISTTITSISQALENLEMGSFSTIQR